MQVESFDFDTELDLDDSVFKQLNKEVTRYLQATSDDPIIEVEPVKDEPKEVAYPTTKHSD